MLNLSPEKMQFISQILTAVISTFGVGFLAIVWRFLVTVSQLPRMEKGIRTLFERVEKLEQEAQKKNGS